MMTFTLALTSDDRADLIELVTEWVAEFDEENDELLPYADHLLALLKAATESVTIDHHEFYILCRNLECSGHRLEQRFQRNVSV